MAIAKPAGTWIYDDLYALSANGKRYEILEGELYEMPSPNWDHSTVVMNLIAVLLPIVQSLRGMLRTAPVDVFFPGADPVVPDLFVLLSDSHATGQGRGVNGPPDLVIEVLSPSNRSHDQVTKRRLYGHAGVQEYWIVDPAARSVEILTRQDNTLLSTAMAQGAGEIRSPLLETTLSLADIFADVGDNEIS